MDELRRELVLANQILADHRIVDGFGHVSVRDPADPSMFLISRSMAPALVAEGDLMTVDLDGVPRGDDRATFLEIYIHSEIYRARPDVAAVVHTHARSVIPFGIVPDVTLRPTYHMCAFLGQGAPVFEIRDAAGDASDMLIRSKALGSSLAASLGGDTVILMRGHGATVVGSSLRQAVFRAVYLETGAQIQLDATLLGGRDIVFLTPAEAAQAAAASDGQIDRAWSLWADRGDQGREGQKRSIA